MNNKFLGFIILIGLFSQCKTQQFNGKNAEAGKCYAKCLMPDKLISDYEDFVVYTGDENVEEVEVEIREVVIQPASSKWVKKKVDINCRAPNPDDCLVWCLVKEDEIVRTVKILVDTTHSDNYTIETIEKNVRIKEGGHTEWREVICQNDLKSSLITKIQNQLLEKLYYNGEVSGKINKMTKEALVQFQRDNELPIGQLDFETLELLGVI